MAIIQKTLFAENLDRYNTFVKDVDIDSKYFKITELSDTLTGGKNAFLIQGSQYLVPDTLIKIEIKDSQGNIVYHEPGEGIISSSVNGTSVVTEYYEGVSKVVSVYVYPDTTFGPATITILGELSQYDNDGLPTPIPMDWEGKYNVKWQRQVNINPALPNTTKIRFYRRPSAEITEILSPIYSIVGDTKVASNVTQSFANIKLSNLETFAGDVKRIKVFRTSNGDISDYDLIQDILVESKELLTTYGLSGSVVGNTGIFTEEVLKNQWNSGSLTASLDSTRVESGVRLSGSGNFKYTQSLDLKSTNTYELNLDAFYSSSTDSNLGIYLVSGSESSSIGTLYGIKPTKNLLDTTIPFTINKDYPSASLYFSQSEGQWHLGNISLKLSQDTAFSPDEVSFVTTMPTVLGNETFNFKFEFYDVNNNYVPVAVTQSALFNGGNNNVGGTLLYISSSASSSLADLTRVSSSISGTVTLTSSSISGTLGNVSSSVSGTITTLSSSVSQSVAFTLSSSLSKVKELADGNYPGVFIDGTTVYAPVLGGTTGYIKELFTVGSTTASTINLDARTTTRKIWIGSGVNGTYNDSTTGVYLDSAGKFSLKDKLTWDGSSTLTVNGTINANAGTFSGNITSTATISGGTISGGTISGGTISIGSGNSIFKADTNGIYLGNATYGSAPFRVSAAGVLTATGANITGAITATSLTLSGFSLSKGDVGLGSVENYSPANQAKVGIEAAITINSGGIAMGTGGYVRGGQSGYNSGTGFFLGYDGGYKFSIGDGSTKGITWDGNTLTIGGNAVIGASTIATIASKANAALTTGAAISSLSNDSGYQNNGSAKTGGSVGGWSIGSDSIYNSNVTISNSSSRIEFKDGSGTVRTRIKQGDVDIGGPVTYTGRTIFGAGGGANNAATAGANQYMVATNASDTTSTGVNTLTVGSAGGGSKVLITVGVPALGNFGATYISGGNPNPYITLTLNYTITCAQNGYNASGTRQLVAVYGSSAGGVSTSVSISTGQAGVSGHEYVVTTSLTKYASATATGTGGYVPSGTYVSAVVYSNSSGTGTMSIAAVQSIAEYGTNGASIGSDDGTYVSFGKAAGSGFTGLFTGNLFVGGTVFASSVSASDRRVKTGILNITNGIQKIKTLRPVDFQWVEGRSLHDVRKRSYGFIADEVEEVFPQLVFEKRNNEIEDFKHLDYQSFHGLTISAVQELISKVEIMESKIIELENKISGSI